MSLAEQYRAKPEGGSRAFITATLSGPSLEDIVVPLTFSGPAVPSADYATDDGQQQIVIPAGARSGLLGITIVDDVVAERHEPIIISIDPPTNATLSETPGSTTVQRDVIPENDAPSVSFTSDEHQWWWLVSTRNCSMRSFNQPSRTPAYAARSVAAHNAMTNSSVAPPGKSNAWASSGASASSPARTHARTSQKLMLCESKRYASADDTIGSRKLG